MMWAIFFWTAGVVELIWSVYLLGRFENVFETDISSPEIDLNQ